MNQADKTQLFYELHGVTQLVRTHFDRRATRFELTRAQWRALKSIGRFEGISQAELAEYLDMEPIPVGRVIDRLEKADFVERRADPDDRRRWRLYLKPKSQPVLEEMDVIVDGLRDDALRGVKRADIDTVMRVLAQLKQNLSAFDGVADADTMNQTRGKS